MTPSRGKWTFDRLPDWLQESVREVTADREGRELFRPTPEQIEWPLFLDAAVVSAFVPKDLAAGELSGDAREQAERSVLTFAETTHQGTGIQWSLTSESRKAVLEQASQDAIHQAIVRTASAGPFSDPVTRALQLCLEGSLEVGAGATLAGLEATRVAVSWLIDVKSLSLPKLDDLDRRITLKRLVSEFQRMVGAVADTSGQVKSDRFFGRDEEIERLRAYVGTVPAGTTWQAATRAFSNVARRFSTWRPLTLWGIGGVGKTTLVAKFMLEHAESAASRYPFAYLDFDRSTVSPRYRERLLVEICTQVAAQFPDIANELQTIQAEALELGRTSGGTLGGAEFDQLRDLTQQFCEVVDKHLTRIEGRLAQRPFLLVFDTFEIVQYGARDVILLEEFVHSFAPGGAPWPRLRLVISGRQAISRFVGALEAMQLEGLPLEGAADMLQTLARDAGKSVDREQCSRIVATVADPGADGRSRVSPLRVRLLAEEFRTGFGDGRTIAQSLLDELSQPLDPNGRIAKLFIDGILIRRVLRHVVDKRVQALADPGLVVRRFDADVIREVMTAATARPDSPEDAPQPWLIDREEASSIFEAFKKEVSLVEEDGTFLRHRADVRREMLPLIRVKSGRQFADLHSRAFAYFDRLARERPSDLSLSAEALYHALWLNKPMAEWVELWRPDAGFQPRVDPEEFDDGSPQHVFLRAKRSDSLSVGEVQRLPRELAFEWLARRAIKVLDESQVDQEIDALVEAMGNDFETLDRAPEVAAASARLLARSGRWDDTLRLTDRQRVAIGDRVLTDAARSIRTYVDGASDANTARVSLLRTEATISAKTGRNRDNQSLLIAAMAATDPLISVELLAYWSLSMPLGESGQSDVGRIIDAACIRISRDRWLKNPRILRLALLSAPNTETLIPIQVESMAGLPRDRAAVALIASIFDSLPQPSGSDAEFQATLAELQKNPSQRAYRALDASWRQLKAEAPKQIVESAETSGAFRKLVVFDHSDWIQALGNALSRALRRSEADVVHDLLQDREFGTAATRRDGGITLVQAIAADGRLLELATALRDRETEIQRWSSDRRNNGIAGLASVLIYWHDALLNDRHRIVPMHVIPAHLRDRASGYLQPQPLDESQRQLDALGEGLRKQPLQRNQLESLLRSNDASERVIGYRQLQLIPDPSAAPIMFGALDAELRLAESLQETRPLWNWLEVFHQLVYKGPGIRDEDRGPLLFGIDRILISLRAHPDADAGRHCLLSAQSLREKLKSPDVQT